MRKLIIIAVGILMTVILTGCNFGKFETNRKESYQLDNTVSFWTEREPNELKKNTDLNNKIEAGDIMVSYPKNELIELEKELYKTIRQDYVNEFLIKEYPSATLNDVSIEFYLGDFNGYIIAYYTNSFTGLGFFTWIVKEKIGGIEFVYPNSNIMLAWKNGKFYTINALYEENELTIKHLEKIHSIISKRKG